MWTTDWIDCLQDQVSVTTWQDMLHVMKWVINDVAYELSCFSIGSRGVQPSEKFFLNVLQWSSDWIYGDEWFGKVIFSTWRAMYINGDLREGRGLISLISWYVCLCARWRIFEVESFMRINMYFEEGTNEQDSEIVLELERLLCRELGMTLYLVGIHSLMSIHKYQCDRHSCFSS